MPPRPPGRSLPAGLAASPEPAPLTRAFDAVRSVFYPATRGEQKRFVRIDAVRAVQAEIARRTLEETRALLPR